MACIVPTLKTADDIRARRQPIDDLTFTFITPLGADNNDIRYGSTLHSCRSPWDLHKTYFASGSTRPSRRISVHPTRLASVTASPVSDIAETATQPSARSRAPSPSGVPAGRKTLRSRSGLGAARIIVWASSWPVPIWPAPFGFYFSMSRSSSLRENLNSCPTVEIRALFLCRFVLSGTRTRTRPAESLSAV